MKLSQIAKIIGPKLSSGDTLLKLSNNAPFSLPFSLKIINFKRENIKISIISLVSDYQLSRKKFQKLKKNFIAFKKLSKNKKIGQKF